MSITLHYLYRMMPDRRLVRCEDRSGIHLGYANREAAESRAAYESRIEGYPVTIDTNPHLHNTRDGRDADISSMEPRIKYYDGSGVEVFTVEPYISRSE